MNKILVISLVLMISFFHNQPVFGIVAVKSNISTEASNSSAETHFSKKELRKIKRKKKQQKRLEKRMKKFHKKWEHKGKKKRRFFGGVTDEPKFKLGIILAVAGFILRIVNVLPFVGWLVAFIAWGLVTTGIILMVWSLIENM